MAKSAKRRRKTDTPDTSSVAELPLSFECPESSSIIGASYDPTARYMRIDFKTGKSYGYGGFPMNLWEEFTLAKSKGGYFTYTIRPMWAGVLIPA